MYALKPYRFPLILLASIFAGGAVGFFAGEKAEVLKPLGDIYLNLMFMVVVPLVFFSIAAAVSNTANMNRFGKIIGSMFGVFILTGIISSLLMLFAVKAFLSVDASPITIEKPDQVENINIADQFVQAFTTSDFVDLLSREHMLALIVFAVLLGLSATLIGEAGKPFVKVLQSGSQVFMKMVTLVMYVAPIGLFAYFASLVGVFGPDLLGTYAKAVAVYYPVALLYFFVGFTLYAFLAGGKEGIVRFWKNILTPAVTALGTGSSVASVPVNLEAAKQTGVPKDVRETVIPIGATVHMDGSCLAAILKISFAFTLFDMDFSGIDTFVKAVVVAILCGVVIAGLPSGGAVGEMLILTMFGLPIEALPVMAALGMIVDPPATMVNVTGDNVSSMLVSRIVEGKGWLKKQIDTKRIVS
ncbi:dicarboxylate/amino acid:cation symporter [Priestia flexa]|uniref:dicarboxylate/amino acid:cation symporter n=1 Tax=Priestia flexa TaxID=86664 RepID=UPI0013D273C8|nr:dicarboxylate/amino acid:cation symporter [Priestia flexa]